MKKTIIISTLLIIAAIIIFTNREKTPTVTNYDNEQTISKNVSTTAGKQIIEVSAKGGYTPRLTKAKANTPTILRIKTSATFDCSSALRIPALSYSTNLPPTGSTDIEVPAQTAGTTLKALCSMGMYNFSINFSS